MPREYELTDEEISKIVSDNYDADPWDSSESAARGAERAAQKKLLEDIKKHVMINGGTSFMTDICSYPLDSEYWQSLLKDFEL